MSIDQLENLVRIRQLQQEPPDQSEIDGMLESAALRLSDATTPVLSATSKFTLIYGAAHSCALAALRWHGYRPKDRYIVFQCLAHTIGFEPEKCGLLGECHRLRNLAEYEGHVEITDTMLAELEVVSNELLEAVRALGAINET